MMRRTRTAAARTLAAVTAALVALPPTATPAEANPTPPAKAEPAPVGTEPRAARVGGADLVSLSLGSGALRLAFRGGGAGLRDPETLRFTAQGRPVGVVPRDPAFGFLGEPGTPVWSLWDDGSRFPALDTTGVDPARVADGSVTLELVSADGPGAFAAYTLSAWGRPDLLLDSDGRTSTELPAGRRTGGVAWLFDAAGEYRVTLRASVRSGTETLRDEATYRVTVPTGPSRDTPTPAPAPQAKAAAAPAPARTAAPAAPARPAAAEAAAAGKAEAAAGKAGKKVISDGHVDMGPQLDGGKLTIRLKDDSATPAVWRELADVTLKATDRARIDVPSGPGYAFLGRAGDKVYLLPQSQQAGIVWPGWNTQHESVVRGTRGDVTWRLRRVSGPGEVKLFRTGSFGTPEIIFDSGRPLPQQLGIAPNTHAHGNWAFTAAGVYRLTVEMAATTTAGRRVSGTGTLTMAVGDSTNTGSTDGGSGKDSAAGGKGGDPGGDLARTGTDVMSIAGGGVLLLTTGALTVLLTRRRRRPRAS